MTPVRTLAFVLALSAGGGLAACGFTPLYGQGEVAQGLATIQVDAPEGRLGYLLREALDDAFARDQQKPARWKLAMNLVDRLKARGLRVDNVASRHELTLTADYQLIDIATGAVLRKGQASSEVTYDSADQPYAAISTQQDADRRAAAEVARKIQLDLAVWLTNRR